MIQALILVVILGALLAVLTLFFPIDARFMKAIGIIIGAVILIMVIEILLGGGFRYGPLFPVGR